MKKIFLFIAVLAAGICTVYADASSDRTTFSLSLSEAIDLGIKNNLDLQNSQIDVKSKTLDAATSWNKILSSSVGVSYSNTLAKYETVPKEDFSVGAGTLSVKLDNSININAANIYGIINAVNDYHDGKLSYENAKATLVKNIKQSYFNLILMRQQIEIAEMEAANAKVAFETSQMKFRDGMVSQVDLLKSELSYKTMLPALDEKINSYINASVDFKRIIGVNNRSRLQLTTQIPENVPDAMSKIRNTDLKNGLDANYTIQTYIHRLKTAVNNRNLAILNMTTPSVSLSHSLGINPLSENIISNTVSVSASFKINTPLPFSSEQVSVAKNVYNLKKAQNDLANAREQQFIDLMKKINNVELYEKTIGIDELNVQIAEKTFQMEESLYKANSVSFLDYEDAKKKLSDARYALAKDINAYLSAIFEIEYLLNMEIVDIE